MSVNPLTPQGLLNRVLTSIVVSQIPALNVTADFMAKGEAVLTFDGPGVDQLDTAIGIVNSPRPFVMAQVVVNLVRSQALPAAYLAQWQTNAVIGTVTVYSDVSNGVFPETVIADCSILDIDPGAFDGADPATKVTIKGVYYINEDLW